MKRRHIRTAPLFHLISVTILQPTLAVPFRHKTDCNKTHHGEINRHCGENNTLERIWSFENRYATDCGRKIILHRVASRRFNMHAVLDSADSGRMRTQFNIQTNRTNSSVVRNWIWSQNLSKYIFIFRPHYIWDLSQHITCIIYFLTLGKAVIYENAYIWW